MWNGPSGSAYLVKGWTSEELVDFSALSNYHAAPKRFATTLCARMYRFNDYIVQTETIEQ